MTQLFVVLLGRRIHRQDGFGLIEVVVAMGVMFLSLTMLAATALVGFSGAATARQRQTATAIADQTIEQVRALQSAAKDGLRDSDLSGDSRIVSCSGTYKLDSCGGEVIVHTPTQSSVPLYPHIVTYGPNTTPSYPDTFTRSVYITNVAGNSSLFRVTVKVSWTAGAAAHDVQTQTILSFPTGSADTSTGGSGSAAYFFGSASSSPGNVIVSPNGAVYNGVGVTGIPSSAWNNANADSIAQTMYTLDAQIAAGLVTKVNGAATLTTPQKKISGTVTSTGGTTTLSNADDDPTTTGVTTSSAPTAVSQSGPTLSLTGGGNSVGLNQYTVVPTTIAFRNVSSTTNQGSSITVTKPTGTISGDFLIAGITIDTNGTISTPSGWTLVTSDASGTTVRNAIFYRFAGSSEPASYTFTLPDNSYAIAGIAAYSGVSASSPIDVQGASTGNGTTATAPSVTSTAANGQLLTFWGAAQDIHAGMPAGMTERWRLNIGTGVGGGENIKDAGAMAGIAVAAAGATGAKSVTLNTATNWVGQSVVLKRGTTNGTAGTETAATVSVTAAAGGTPCGNPTQSDGKACAYSRQSYSSSNAAFLETAVDLAGYGLGTCSLYAFSPPTSNPTNYAYGRRAATSGDGKITETVARYYGTHTFGSLCGGTGTTPTNWPGYLVKFDAANTASTATAEAGVSAASPTTSSAGTISVYNSASPTGVTSFSIPTTGTWSTTPSAVSFTTSSNYKYDITSILASSPTSTTATGTTEANAVVGAPVIGTINYKLTDVTNSRILIDVKIEVDLGSLIAYAKYTAAA